MFGFGKKLLQRSYGETPVPLGKILLLRRLAWGENPLFPRYENIIQLGKSLHNPFLARHLEHREFGRWSLTVSTLNYLERRIKALRPEMVLEFGSGVSTVCLARYMQELHGEATQPRVLSIDQELPSVGQTQQRLRELGLGEYVRIAHHPVRRQEVEGLEIDFYDLSPESLEELLQGHRPDFVLVDGPHAHPGARFGALPLMQPCVAPGAHVFLDDALRDGELRVAKLWSRLPGVEVLGLSLVGKGLLIVKNMGEAPVTNRSEALETVEARGTDDP